MPTFNIIIQEVKMEKNSINDLSKTQKTLFNLVYKIFLYDSSIDFFFKLTRLSKQCRLYLLTQMQESPESMLCHKNVTYVPPKFLC